MVDVIFCFIAQPVSVITCKITQHFKIDFDFDYYDV